jgi:hypothetical protein
VSISGVLRVTCLVVLILVPRWFTEADFTFCMFLFAGTESLLWVIALDATDFAGNKTSEYNLFKQ